MYLLQIIDPNDQWNEKQEYQGLLYLTPHSKIFQLDQILIEYHTDGTTDMLSRQHIDAYLFIGIDLAIGFR